jgi:aryl-alcohol dehydrogenase-like predicted oxidoreductase
VDAALDAGVTFFDTAETYGNGGDSERFLGEILEGRRDRIVLATKFGWGQVQGTAPPRACARRSRVSGAPEDRLR